MGGGGGGMNFDSYPPHEPTNVQMVSINAGSIGSILYLLKNGIKEEYSVVGGGSGDISEATGLVVDSFEHTFVGADGSWNYVLFPRTYSNIISYLVCWEEYDRTYNTGAAVYLSDPRGQDNPSSGPGMLISGQDGWHFYIRILAMI